jgi:hypothetical protein
MLHDWFMLTVFYINLVVQSSDDFFLKRTKQISHTFELPSEREDFFTVTVKSVIRMTEASRIDGWIIWHTGNT